MTIARILSGTGLTAMTAPVLAHGEHWSILVTQLLSHSLSGEHLLVAAGIAAFFIFYDFGGRSSNSFS